MNKNFMNIENTVNVYDFGADGTALPILLRHLRLLF